jgi:hypothetical protein
MGRRGALEIEGVDIPTMSLDDPMASKRTGRPQDVADLAVLEEIRRLKEIHGDHERGGA